MKRQRFQPNRRLSRWLRGGPEGDEPEGPGWDGWVLRRMGQGAIVKVGDVFVDRAVLRQRFGCVSDRCAPGQGRGRSRSCCADAEVVLDAGERRRILRLRRPLKALVAVRGALGLDLVCASSLSRPRGRCVFSAINRAGQIRCRLHAFARRRGIDRMDVQPLSCRLFPLVVVDLGQGRTLLTVVSRSTHRLVGAHPADRYPCLSDPDLPLLVRTMRGDLDWAFGRGFAQALEKVAENDQ